MEACWAHNPEIRGSKPRSASNFLLFKKMSEDVHFLFLVTLREKHWRTRATKISIGYIWPCQRIGVRE